MLESGITGHMAGLLGALISPRRVPVRPRELPGHGCAGRSRTRTDRSAPNARDPVSRSNPGTSLVLPVPPGAVTPGMTKDRHGCGARRAGHNLVPGKEPVVTGMPAPEGERGKR